jgi:hypothetical protein
MRIAALLIFLCSFSLFGREYLVQLKSNVPVLDGVRIIRIMEEYKLGVANDPALFLLKNSEIEYSVLDTKDDMYEYYLVSRCREQDATLEKFGIILAKYTNCLIYRTTSAIISTMEPLQMQLERLILSSENVEPSFLYKGGAGTKYSITAPDTLIVSMLKKVEIDTLRAVVKRMQSFPTRKAGTNDNKTTVVNWLLEKMKSYCDTAYLQKINDQWGSNIIGIKYGKSGSKTNYACIGAHMDAVKDASNPTKAAGADDNASGTAAVLETARVMKNYTFDKTVQFHCWNAEEVGFYGSDAAAKAAKSRGDKIIGAVLNFDMIGHTANATSKTGKLYCEGTSDIAASKEFTTVTFPSVCKTYVPDVSTETSAGSGPGYGSDHVSWNKQGFPAMMAIEGDFGNNKSYHKTEDTLDRADGLNNMVFFENCTKAGLASMATLAVPIGAAVTVKTMNLQISNGFQVKIIGAKNLSVDLSGWQNGPVDFSLHRLDGKSVWNSRMLVNNNDNMVNFNFDLSKHEISETFYILTCKSLNRTISQKVVLK